LCCIQAFGAGYSSGEYERRREEREEGFIYSRLHRRTDVGDGQILQTLSSHHRGLLLMSLISANSIVSPGHAGLRCSFGPQLNPNTTTSGGLCMLFIFPDPRREEEHVQLSSAIRGTPYKHLSMDFRRSREGESTHLHTLRWCFGVRESEWGIGMIVSTERGWGFIAR
jgi:hypothetical protein